MCNKILEIKLIILFNLIMKSNNMNSEKINSDEEKIIEEYIKSMDDKERMAYEIAKEHLESSFDLVKSLGYIKFAKKINKK